MTGARRRAFGDKLPVTVFLQTLLAQGRPGLEHLRISRVTQRRPDPDRGVNSKDIPTFSEKGNSRTTESDDGITAAAEDFTEVLRRRLQVKVLGWRGRRDFPEGIELKARDVGQVSLQHLTVGRCDFAAARRRKDR